MATLDVIAAPNTASVSAETLRCWLAADEALLIDVRDPEEFEDERIPGALLHPLGNLQADALPAATGRRRVLVCLSGKRSAKALTQLQQAGITDLFHLDGGLLGFKKAGGRTVEADSEAEAA
jgi:rhodanese-related sulfurtransferase